jgi:hypothetical protein
MPQGLPNAIHDPGVAAIEHLGKQDVEQSDEFRRYALLRQTVEEALMRDFHVANGTSGGPGDFCNRLGKGQQAGTGEFVEPAAVFVLGQRCDRGIGDVLRIDKRFRDIAGGEREFPRADPVEEEVLAEVLTEPAGAQDGPLDPGAL